VSPTYRDEVSHLRPRHVVTILYLIGRASTLGLERRSMVFVWMVLSFGCNALTGLDGDYQVRGDATATAATGDVATAGGGGAAGATSGGGDATTASSSSGPMTTCPPGLDGEGSEASPCLVTTCEELQAMGLVPAHYRLANDVDCLATKTWNGGAGFKPVEGVFGFDGADHTIANLTIDRPTTSSVGLFKSTQSMTGALRGPLRLTNVNITGQDDVGAVGGVLWQKGKWPAETDVIVTGVVRGRERVGGIAGKVEGIGQPLVKVWFDGEVSGAKRVGGLVGLGAPLSIAESGAHAVVSATGNGAGGLLGEGSALTRLANTMFVGTVSAVHSAGGIAAGGVKEVDASYAVVTLKLPKSGSGAGLVYGMENVSKVTRSFAVARIVVEPAGESANAGGLVYSSGFYGSNLKFADAYWLDFAGDPAVDCLAIWEPKNGLHEGCTAVPESDLGRFYDATRAPLLSWSFSDKPWSEACSPAKGYPVLAFLPAPFAKGCVKGLPP